MKLQHIASLLVCGLLFGCASTQNRLQQEDISRLNWLWHHPVPSCVYAEITIGDFCYIPLESAVSKTPITTIDERFFLAKEICFKKINGSQLQTLEEKRTISLEDGTVAYMIRLHFYCLIDIDKDYYQFKQKKEINILLFRRTT
jgi:hypothetical protein